MLLLKTQVKPRTCITANKYCNICEGVEELEKKKDVASLPSLSCELSVPVKKKKTDWNEKFDLAFFPIENSRNSGRLND